VPVVLLLAENDERRRRDCMYGYLIWLDFRQEDRDVSSASMKYRRKTGIFGASVLEE